MMHDDTPAVPGGVEIHACDPYTRTGGTGTGVRSDRIEDDPIHTIHCHDTSCVYL